MIIVPKRAKCGMVEVTVVDGAAFKKQYQSINLWKNVFPDVFTTRKSYEKDFLDI